MTFAGRVEDLKSIELGVQTEFIPCEKSVSVPFLP